MKRLTVMLLSILCLFLLGGCADSREVDESKVVNLYYISKSETKLEVYEYEMNAQNAQEALSEMFGQLENTPEKLEYKAPLAMGFEVLDYEIEEGRLYLNVDEHYKQMKPTTEVLVRAALVRTFTQIKDVSYVSITVAGEQLHDSLGNLVGLMSAEQFIDNAGTEINAYEIVKLKLYFANEEGTALVATNQELRYNTNIPMEKLVMERLIAGPDTEEVPVHPTVNPDTKIVSIAVKDGICYVNLTDAFLTQIYNVSSDVAIYSVVNSLIELTNVNKVQISINGETSIMYRESYSLATVFERNLDLITTLE